MEKALLFDIGVGEYSSVLDLQHRLVRRRVAGEIPDSLILVEHPHVITLGRRANMTNVLSDKVPVVRVERGGDVTYHGPGQLVGYPILALAPRGNDLRKYVRDLEDVMIHALERYGIAGRHVDKKPGVWITDRIKRERKIAAIGVAVSHWVTYHGFALNVNTDLAYFHLINPCGYSSDVMTSVAEQVGQRVVFDEVKEAVLEAFAEKFGVDFHLADPAECAGGWPGGVRAETIDEEVPSPGNAPAHGHPA